MSLFYDRPSETPQLHVLIIGVGNYPYLDPSQISVGEQEDKLIDYRIIKPLTSPPQSAAALYNLVLDLNNTGEWVRPLGSIHLLISDNPIAGRVLQDVNYGAATFMNIQSAHDDWRQRCESHKDNVALFYFCGHGLQKEDQFLLPEDFGCSTLHLWDYAINFNNSRLSFQKCKAETQLFFIDSCRVLLGDMLLRQVKGRDLGEIELPVASAKHDLTIYSTSPGESAYGRQNEPSFFAKALINGLRGQATESYEKSWVVTTNDIAKNIHRLLNPDSENRTSEQRCNVSTSKPAVIVKLNRPPEVQAMVTCDPGAALGHAELSCCGLNSTLQFRRAPHIHPWELNIEVGMYSLGATFSERQYNDARENTVIQPFRSKKVINIT